MCRVVSISYNAPISTGISFRPAYYEQLDCEEGIPINEPFKYSIQIHILLCRNRIAGNLPPINLLQLPNTGSVSFKVGHKHLVN